MQPIIRRTIKITIIETWTISWEDGQATAWHDTQVVDRPVMAEQDEPLPLITDDQEEDCELDGTADDLRAAD